MDIKSMTLPELQEEMATIGEKSFRAKQLYEWIHVRQARSFDEMTNLSVALRERCRERYDLTTLKVVRMQESKLDGTRKYLFELKDGNLVESVFMRYSMETVCAFLPRWAAGWDAGSVPRHSMDGNGI